MDFLDYAFMQRALLAALLVGIIAPAVGIFLVQRRQAIMGDGIGHVALTGVALGFLLQVSPVWMAVVVSSLGAGATGVALPVAAGTGIVAGGGGGVVGWGCGAGRAIGVVTAGRAGSSVPPRETSTAVRLAAMPSMLDVPV